MLDSYGWTYNADRPWLDAGGPGDTVYIVVTFNHPLITPLGLAAFLPLQARRVAVNEAFRSPRAVPPGNDIPKPPTLLPTDTPTATREGTDTPTPTDTPIPSDTPTGSPTSTATEVFECTDVTAGPLNYGNDKVTVTIHNARSYDTYLSRVVVVWQPPSGYTGMGATAMTLNSQSIWTGFDNGSPYTDVGNDVTVGAGTPTPPASAEFPFNTGADLRLRAGRHHMDACFHQRAGAAHDSAVGKFQRDDVLFRRFERLDRLRDSVERQHADADQYFGGQRNTDGDANTAMRRYTGSSLAADVRLGRHRPL